MTDVEHETDLRARAVKRLKKQRDFRTHLLVYLLVNLFLVAVWALTDGTDSSGRSSRWSVGALA